MLDFTDRNTLVASLPKGLKIAEIGVAHGLFSERILTGAEPAILYLIDCWQHQSSQVVGNDPANAPQEVQDQMYLGVCQKFSSCPDVVVKRMFSLDAAKTFQDGELDVVYLDANHLDVGRDIEAWWPKVKSGGWLMGHDYTVAGDYIRVKPIVDAWVHRNNLWLEVAGLKSDDTYERSYPTWVVRKP